MKNLVAYSSSESESEVDSSSISATVNQTTVGVHPRLPLPNQIKNLQFKSIHDLPEDNPGEHDGRIRSFQHERGNWATYVFIPINFTVLNEIQDAMVELVQSNVKLKKAEDTHISLTRTVILQHHWIDTFVSSVREELAMFNKFKLEWHGLKVYCNEERTRTFIGLRVSDYSSNYFKGISKRLDTILKDYRLPEFYKDPSFHCSLLWCVGDYEVILNENLHSLEATLQNYLEEYSEEMQIDVNTVYCKTGNKLFHFDLS